MEKEIESLLSNLLNANIAKYCIMPYLDPRELYVKTNLLRLDVCVELMVIHNKLLGNYTNQNTYMNIWKFTPFSFIVSFFKDICCVCKNHCSHHSFVRKLCKTCAKKRTIRKMQQEEKLMRN
jgi:hypothetical protein